MSVNILLNHPEEEGALPSVFFFEGDQESIADLDPLEVEPVTQTQLNVTDNQDPLDLAGEYRNCVTKKGRVNDGDITNEVTPANISSPKKEKCFCECPEPFQEYR